MQITTNPTLRPAKPDFGIRKSSPQPRPSAMAEPDCSFLPIYIRNGQKRDAGEYKVSLSVIKLLFIVRL